MADPNARIEQFRKMAEADPENELGHFSLGKACLDAGRPQEAIEPLRRTVQLNPNQSRGYHLLATALLATGQKQEAIAELTRGVEVAASRGDLMPKNDMVQMLREQGAPVPAAGEAQVKEQPVGEGQVLCSRCGRVGPKLPGPPFRNDQGRLIHEKVCADCWREWIGMGTKVINELRLPLNDPQAQRIFDQHMMEFLNLR
jgi:Fe-S cluster biosynthesis and repair protein YggX